MKRTSWGRFVKRVALTRVQNPRIVSRFRCRSSSSSDQNSSRARSRSPCSWRECESDSSSVCVGGSIGGRTASQNGRRRLSLCDMMVSEMLHSSDVRISVAIWGYLPISMGRYPMLVDIELTVYAWQCHRRLWSPSPAQALQVGLASMAPRLQLHRPSWLVPAGASLVLVPALVEPVGYMTETRRQHIRKTRYRTVQPVGPAHLALLRPIAVAI